MDRIILLIDVGGSSLKANLSHVLGEDDALMLERDIVLDIDANGELPSITSTFEKLIQYLLLLGLRACPGGISVEGVALAVPGPCDYERGILQMKGLSKYQALYGIPFFPLMERIVREEAERIKQMTEHKVGVSSDLKMIMQNDARMYAYGIWVQEGSRTDCRVASLTLGTGCGSSFIVDGELLTDDVGQNAAEGVPADGYIYHLPLSGKIVDDWLSTRGLIELARMNSLEVGSGQELAQLAEAGVESAVRGFRMFGELLDEVIHSDELIGRFKPDVIYLGGRISRSYHLMELDPQVELEVHMNGRNPLIGVAAYWRKRYSEGVCHE